MTYVTQRARGVSSFEVMDVLERADQLERAGRDIIHLEVGEPDFVTADPIRAAGRAAIDAGHTRYTPALGLPELRAAVAGHYAARFGISLPAERVVITSGATGALGLLMALLIEAGDDVLLADPGYPCYANFVRLAGARPVTVPIDQWQGTRAADYAAAWTAATRALLVGTPCNPTGEVLGEKLLAELAQLARGRGAHFIVDEIYHGLTFCEPAPPTALAVDAGVFVVNSFSKYFGMTGWRIGWLVAPADTIGTLNRLSQNTVISPSTIAQHAALAAFSDSATEVHEARRGAFLQRRNFLVPALKQLGFAVPRAPEGAFYVYAGLHTLGFDDARAFCRELLEATGVAVTPGTDFGQHDAGRWIRFALTVDVARLEEALGRMRSFLAERGGA